MCLKHYDRQKFRHKLCKRAVGMLQTVMRKVPISRQLRTTPRTIRRLGEKLYYKSVVSCMMLIYIVCVCRYLLLYFDRVPSISIAVIAFLWRFSDWVMVNISPDCNSRSDEDNILFSRPLQIAIFIGYISRWHYHFSGNSLNLDQGFTTWACFCWSE